MRILMFYHSLISDWNHGNAHFLRGVASELMARGHSVKVFEPADAWSASCLIREHGTDPIRRFHEAYPGLTSIRYEPAIFNPDPYLEKADLVLVHEWNDPALVQRIGRHRSRSHRKYRLFFHDTHHRSFSSPESLRACDLSGYDGVLAYGRVLKEIYESSGLAARAWVWHEAADTRVFRPCSPGGEQGDLVWIGNWWDDERTAELNEYLIEPVRDLGLRAMIYGVRYPSEAWDTLAASQIGYGGWLPNFEVPQVFSRFRVTVHVPRRYYSRILPGIPTIRPFEALACGIPLVSAPWEDAEHLFREGIDFLVARDGGEMRRLLREVLNNPDLRLDLARSGRETILSRHTCAHRVNELLSICQSLAPAPVSDARMPASTNRGKRTSATVLTP